MTIENKVQDAGFHPLKNIGRGYAFEQTASTFNTEGWEYAEKHFTKGIEGKFSREVPFALGILAGLVQDVSLLSIAKVYADHGSTDPHNPVLIASSAYVLGKMLTNLGAVAWKGYKAMKTARAKPEVKVGSRFDDDLEGYK